MDNKKLLLTVAALLDSPENSSLESSTDSEDDDDNLLYLHLAINATNMNKKMIDQSVEMDEDEVEEEDPTDFLHSEQLFEEQDNLDSSIKILDYVVNVVSLYSDETFKNLFRVNRETVKFLTECVEQASILPSHAGGRKKINAEAHLLITLNYLGTNESLREIATRFDVSLHSVWNVIRRTICWLCMLESNYIKWPQNESEIEEISNQFYQIKGIEGVMGALMGAHIKISCSKVLNKSYMNNELYYSIILQVVSTADLQIIYANTKGPGSMPYGRMLIKSSLTQEIAPTIPQDKFIICDSAYPSLPWLVPPFKDFGTLNEDQLKFNELLTETLAPAEHVLILLKSRFSRLCSFTTQDLNHITMCVTAACILHNICNLRDDTYILEDEKDSEELLSGFLQEIEMEDEDDDSQNTDKRAEVFKKMIKTNS